MNTVEFVENVPASQLALLFKDYFEQHMYTYSLLKNIQFVRINSIDMDKASIMYSVKLSDTEDRNKLVEVLKSHAESLNIYGRHYSPDIFLNGDLLCITIKK